MNSNDYIWEKMLVAIECLCGEGSFKSRLENATNSALIRLRDDDAKGKMKEDLEYIFELTRRNIKAGKILKEPDELERKKLIEKMLHILLETTRHSAEQQAILDSIRHQEN
jgi:hypothetical protein